MVKYEDAQRWIDSRLGELAQERVEDAKELGTKAEALAVERVERFLSSYIESSDIIPGCCPSYIHCQSLVVGVALSYEGVSEKGKTNTGYLVNLWHEELGLNPGLPWCVIWNQHVYRKVSDAVGMPDLLPFNTPSTQKCADVAESKGLFTIDVSKATPGSSVIFRDGEEYLGHQEILLRTTPTVYDSIGGNTNSEFSRDGGDVGLHHDRGWGVYGPVGTMRSAERRWTRGIIPLPALYEKYWRGQ